MAKRQLSDLQRLYAREIKGQRGGPSMGRPGGPPRHGVRPKGKPKNTKQTVGRLWKYVSSHKFSLILVIILMMCSTFTSLAGSYVLRPVINNAADRTVAASERIENLLAILVIIAVIYLVGIVSSYFQQRLMLTIAQNAVEKIRNDLFVKLQELPVRFFDSNSTGDLMSRFTNDIDNINMMINTTIVQLVSGTVTLLGTLVMMIYTSPILTLITVVFTPVFMFGGGLIAKKSSKYYSSQQAALGAVNGYIEETVSGSKVVKVFNHEQVCEEEFGLINEDLRSKQFNAQFYGGIMGPIMGNISQIAYAVTAGVGGLLCLFRSFDIGGVSVFCNYSRQFAMPINMLSQQTSTVFAALAGAERVFGIMDLTPEQAELPKVSKTVTEEDVRKYALSRKKYNGKGLTAEIRGDVELHNVTFGYNPNKTVLKNITLYAHPGQKIAFVGSTGAGKTTVTNLLNRFYDIDDGFITVDGIDIRDYDRDHLRSNIAMVLQDTHLFTGTVMENIRYGRLDATDEEVIAAAKTASAHSFIMRLEKGYDTVLTGDGANLSQGQRQLLNIARAALSKAPILVLDEATSSVDTRTERHIEHGMDRLMKNRTTFVIAHRLSTVRNANAIMVLEAGEIIERGSHDQLLEMGGRYYELYTGKKELD